MSRFGFSSSELKAKLLDGKVVVGCMLGHDAPWLVELLGLIGYDFVTFDLEHEPLSEGAVTELIRAADGANLASLVRMACDDRLPPFLNAGVSGVQVPDLRNLEHARALVRATRFYPVGRRLYAPFARGADYGIGLDERTYIESINSNFLVIGMIESIELVGHLDDLLEIEGIDGFHIGPGDLVQSMDFPDPDEVEATIADVIARCRSAGKFVGAGMTTPWGLDTFERRVQQGAQMFTFPAAWLVAHAAAQFHGDMRSRIPDEKLSGKAAPGLPTGGYPRPGVG